MEYPSLAALPKGTRKGALVRVQGVGSDANGYYAMDYQVQEPKFQVGHGAHSDRKWIVVNAHTGAVVSRHTSKKKAQRQLKGLN